MFVLSTDLRLLILVCGFLLVCFLVFFFNSLPICV